MPPFSTTTISPGSTSRMNSASIRSNELVSLDSTNASLSRPITSGRKPFGSRTPIILLVAGQQHQRVRAADPAQRRDAACRATSGSRAFAIRWTMTSVSLEVWKIEPWASSSARSSVGVDQVAVVGDRDLRRRRTRTRTAGRCAARSCRRWSTGRGRSPSARAASPGSSRSNVSETSAHRDVAAQPAVLRGDQPGRLLAPVLQRVQAQIRDVGRLVVSVDAEDAAHGAHLPRGADRQ